MSSPVAADTPPATDRPGRSPRGVQPKRSVLSPVGPAPDGRVRWLDPAFPPIDNCRPERSSLRGTGGASEHRLLGLSRVTNGPKSVHRRPRHSDCVPIPSGLPSDMDPSVTRTNRAFGAAQSFCSGGPSACIFATESSGSTNHTWRCAPVGVRITAEPRVRRVLGRLVRIQRRLAESGIMTSAGSGGCSAIVNRLNGGLDLACLVERAAMVVAVIADSFPWGRSARTLWLTLHRRGRCRISTRSQQLLRSVRAFSTGAPRFSASRGGRP